MQSLRAHHGNDFDILVLDNAPERCVRTEQVTNAVKGTYYHRPDLSGTSRSRDAIFRLAKTPWVMVVDSHVLFEPGAIAKLITLIDKPEYANSLLTGPLVMDDGVGIATHWRPTTPPGLWGVWDADPRGHRWNEEPFDIPMQGLGCFAMRRESWPGFHPKSRGFGGEEGYIHEKVRRQGGRVLCVPQLRWRHRFRDIGGFSRNPTPYAALGTDHAFNLLIQHRELGIDAVDAIKQDFGPPKMSVENWERILKEAKETQPNFMEAATVPSRQRIVGVWYTDNTAPPNLLVKSLASISAAAKQTWRHDVELVACGWERPQSLPDNVQFVRFSGERKRSHATIVKQIQQALDAANDSGRVPIIDYHLIYSHMTASPGNQARWEIVSFLEHDVLYPQDYFQRVGDAFATHPSAPVVSNLDYIGLNAQGFQPVKERHEPMHQLSMRLSFALANLERAAKEAESGIALLEPQGDRSSWVRLQPSTGDLGLAPSIHVNHTAGRFTSHGDVCYALASSTTHPHWGEHRSYWPHEVVTVAKQGCGSCGNSAPAVKYENLGAWFDAASKNPSDFHEHMATLRDLAAKCEHVTQIGIWGKPSRAALSQNGAMFADYSPGQRPEWPELKRLMGDNFDGKEWQPDFAIEPTDLLFIDTYHTAEETYNLFTRHSPQVRKYLVVHTTTTFGETGDQAGKAGVRVGIRRFIAEHKEWTVIRDDTNNHGLMVLSRLDEDRKALPSLMRKGLNFASAKAKHLAAGRPTVSEEVFNFRMELCLLCPERAHDSCSACGCPLEAKLAYATEPCGLVKLGREPKWEAVA